MEAIYEEYRRDPGYIWQSINLGMRMSYLMKNILYISAETYNGVPFFLFSLSFKFFLFKSVRILQPKHAVFQFPSWQFPLLCGWYLILGFLAIFICLTNISFMWVEESLFSIVTFWKYRLLFLRLAESMNWLVIRLFCFSCKGLALDLEDGNFIKLADNGTVLR